MTNFYRKEVLILYVNGRITTEVYQYIVFFFDCMLSGVCKFLNCIIYHVGYCRGPYVCYIMLDFMICGVYLCFVMVSWQHVVSHVLNILIRIVLWTMTSLT